MGVTRRGSELLMNLHVLAEQAVGNYAPMLDAAAPRAPDGAVALVTEGDKVEALVAPTGESFTVPGARPILERISRKSRGKCKWYRRECGRWESPEFDGDIPWDWFEEVTDGEGPAHVRGPEEDRADRLPDETAQRGGDEER